MQSEGHGESIHVLLFLLPAEAVLLSSLGVVGLPMVYSPSFLLVKMLKLIVRCGCLRFKIFLIGWGMTRETLGQNIGGKI